jgi:hypothetical protein
MQISREVTQFTRNLFNLDEAAGAVDRSHVALRNIA